MLTRLQVSGFKNLVDVDLHLGSFTCVVGPNGSGKSNLFDAVRFLGALANHTLLEAAASVRDQHSRAAQIRDLFHHVGSHYADNMRFVAEMIVSESAIDDLGQEAKASITFLRYSLELAYRESNDSLAPGALEIIKEELVHVAQRDAPKTEMGLRTLHGHCRMVPSGFLHCRYWRAIPRCKAFSVWKNPRTAFIRSGFRPYLSC